MMLGELVTRYTVRAALALYLSALVLRLAFGSNERWQSRARVTWSAGFVLFVVHVVCAFHFFHHWSHDAAYLDTVQKTAAVTGWNWGGGVYINYLFALIWGFDVLWWWHGLWVYQNRSKIAEWCIQSFLFFITFNATIVFGTGLIRWAGIAGCVILFVTFVLRRRRLKIA